MVIGNCAVTKVLVILALGLLFGAAPGVSRAGTTERVSVASDGAQGNDNSEDPSISADGRFVAFYSLASSLVAGDTNGKRDIFVHDRQTGQTERVSVASDGTQANDWSRYVSISADGRFVSFQSAASNLVAGDTNGKADAFVHDRQTGQTTRVSVTSDGAQGDDSSDVTYISGNGRFVAFSSKASNLVAGDTNGEPDIFVHDRQTGQTERVSVASDGTQANDISYDLWLSGDGRFVAFESVASNLVAGDTNETGDIFVHDRQTGQTTRVSVASDGTEANGYSYYPTISADGRFAAFGSSASNLVAGDTNAAEDVFIHDRQTGQTTRISVASDRAQGNGDSWKPSPSADSRFVAFDSAASNLVAGDTNGKWDIFLHDRQTGQTTRLSVAPDGAQGNGDSRYPCIGAEGLLVAFYSGAGNLVAGDTNGSNDVFLHVRAVRLTVDSAPIIGVSVTGDQPGETEYTALCEPDQAVNLTAPAAISLGGTNYTFDRWYVDNVPGTRGEATVEVMMDSHHTAVAQYDWRLDGDLTGDCTVNILDMIYVRNRLNETCSE